jgi:hypothetical protein
MPTQSKTEPLPGLDPHPEFVQPGLREAFDPQSLDIPAQLAAHVAQMHELRAQVEQLRAERDRLAERQRQIAELIKCPNPEKVMHDLRNLLNELQLYKMLVETQAK